LFAASREVARPAYLAKPTATAAMARDKLFFRRAAELDAVHRAPAAQLFRKFVLRLLDLDHPKRTVLDSLGSPDSAGLTPSQ